MIEMIAKRHGQYAGRAPSPAPVTNFGQRDPRALGNLQNQQNITARRRGSQWFVAREIDWTSSAPTTRPVAGPRGRTRHRLRSEPVFDSAGRPHAAGANAWRSSRQNADTATAMNAAARDGKRVIGISPSSSTHHRITQSNRRPFRRKSASALRLPARLAYKVERLWQACGL